jgi:hypothetical protein
VRLPVTFGKHENYRTELIDLYMARIGLPYNAILGYPALAMFMAVTHPGFNIVKMPGSSGVIIVALDRKDVVRALKLAYAAAEASCMDAEGASEAPEATPETKKVLVDGNGLGPTFTICIGLPPE